MQIWLDFMKKVWGGKRNLKRAREEYEMSLKQGQNRFAISKLIIFYSDGIGGDTNPAMAISWIKYLEKTRNITPTVERILKAAKDTVMSNMTKLELGMVDSLYKNLEEINDEKWRTLNAKSHITLELSIAHAAPKNCTDSTDLSNVWWFEPLRERYLPLKYWKE